MLGIKPAARMRMNFPHKAKPFGGRLAPDYAQWGTLVVTKRQLPYMQSPCSCIEIFSSITERTEGTLGQVPSLACPVLSRRCSRAVARLPLIAEFFSGEMTLAERLR